MSSKSRPERRDHVQQTYQARMDGLKYALEIVERGGIEELKKEIRVRNAQFIPLEVSAKKANEIS